MSIAVDQPPKPGEIVRVRSRRYLVEAVDLRLGASAACSLLPGTPYAQEALTQQLHELAA